MSTIEWPGIGLTRPPFPNLPRLGPTITEPASAAAPPTQ